MSNVFDVIFCGIFLAAIWWLYAFVYREYKIDESRQQLFAIRDELFDKATAGIISFDDEAYGLTRNTLNGLIRFTHELSVIRLIVMSWVCRDFDEEYAERFCNRLNNAFEKLTDEQREIYQMAFINAHWVLNMHLAHTNPVFTITFLPFHAVLFLLKMIRHFKNGYKNTVAHVHQLSISKDWWKKIDARANFIAHYHHNNFGGNTLNPA